VLVPLWQFACKCARAIRKAACWAYKHIVLPTLRFVWRQILCRIGRALRWVARQIKEAVRQLWNLLVIKPLRWLWKRIIFPIVNRIYQRLLRKLILGTVAGTARDAIHLRSKERSFPRFIW